MANERRRLSTDSDKSSTSTTHSIESTRIHPILPFDKDLPTRKIKKIVIGNTKSNPVKRVSSMSSPAEILLARTKNTFIDLNAYFQCSSLPNHWRKNKSLQFVVVPKNEIQIKTNTRVVILAGNEYNASATLKNNVSWFRDNQAEFNDLRFLTASGRGKKFTLSIIIETSPPQQCTYRRAIKITVDGPRKKRELKPKSDVNDTHGDDSNIDVDSDNETQTPNVSVITETKPAISTASSGLLLLAAAAEQKQKDEEDTSCSRSFNSSSMDTSYSVDCLALSSSLASQFSQSIVFSPTSDNLSPLHTKRHVFSPPQPIVPQSPTKNIILSLTSAQNCFDFYQHSPQQRDQQTMTTSSNNNSTSNASTSTHVLCR